MTFTPIICASCTVLLEALLIARSVLGIGMNGITVATERRHLNAAILEFLHPCFGLRGIGEKFVDRAMIRSRIAARADFHGLQAERADLVDHGVERKIRVHRIKHADGNFLFCSGRNLRGTRQGILLGKDTRRISAKCDPPGIAAASRPVLVAARNCLRSRPADESGRFAYGVRSCESLQELMEKSERLDDENYTPCGGARKGNA